MRLPVIAALTAVALAAAACGSSGTPTAISTQTVTVTSTPTQQTTKTSVSVTPNEPTACDELKGTVSDGACVVHEGTKKYTVDMKFPADYPDTEAVVDLMNTQRDGFLGFIDKQPDPDYPYALDITSKEFRSGDPTTGTVSVVFTEYSSVGGAHPETEYDALNYDLAKNSPITLDTLFKPGSNPTAVLDPIVKAEFEKRLDGPIDDNPNGLDTYKNFALTDDAVMFFIGQGVWAFEAAGQQDFSIPRSQLASILA